MEARVSIVTLGVKDLIRAKSFYHSSLGFPVANVPSEGIVFLKTSGCCLALYPLDKLAADISPQIDVPVPGFSGITLAHNVKTRDEVDAIMAQAERAGASVQKPPQETFWGGYSGYFSDLDGYMWEVAYGAFEFNADGSLRLP